MKVVGHDGGVPNDVVRGVYVVKDEDGRLHVHYTIPPWFTPEIEIVLEQGEPYTARDEFEAQALAVAMLIVADPRQSA